jgi:hypothetical protein
VSESVCESHDLDYKKVLLDNIDYESNSLAEHDKYNDISVVISSAITAYARVFMNKIKLDILSKGGHLYYTDTDSIVTNIKLDNKLVGNDIGQFKLVSEIKEGYFISNKSYALKTFSGKTIIKCKGFSNIKTLDDKTKSLSFEDFENVYRGSVVEGTRYESKRDYNTGVLLNKNVLKFSPFAYTKRVKVLNKNKLWIDTLPINMQNNTYHTLNPIIIGKNVTTMKKFFIFITFIILYTLCVISLIIYILLVPQFGDVTDNVVDILDITDFSDIVDTTDVLDYVDCFGFINFDTEIKFGERSIYKEQFDEFIKLFNREKTIYSKTKINNFDSDIKSSCYLYTTLDRSDLESVTGSTKVDIIKPLLRYNLDSLSKDIGDLQDQVALLQIDLQKEKIQNIDARKYYEKTIDFVINDLEQIQNKISRSPKL